MFLFLFSLVTISFLVFFYGLDLWYLGLFPLIFLFLFMGSFSFRRSLNSFSFDFSRYGLYLAWLLILASGLGLLTFFGLEILPALLGLLVVNIVLLVGSYVFDYTDGKSLFAFGYAVVFASLLLFGLVEEPLVFGDFSRSLVFLHTGVFGFLIFIVGFWYSIDRNFLYTFFVSILLGMLLLVMHFIPSLPLSLAVNSILLTGVYTGMWRFVQKKPVVREYVSVRRILAGERITTKSVFSDGMLQRVFEFVDSMPVFFQYVLEFLNVFVVMVLIGFFLGHRGILDNSSQFIYWLVISFFVGNVLLLKKLGYSSILQNFFLFLVVHFAVYISFFSYFGGHLDSLVLWASIWNLATTGFLFYAPKVLEGILVRRDYWYWIVASGISFLVNVVLLVQSGLAGELIFFLTLLYTGIEGMLIFYAVKSLGNKE